ncbi:MAG: PQQ-binding-like beta-propeller repeat protein [Phycisphaerae bacterium]|nr:PQQ-binding-like beta-propeller repeat protein [Phycisphaerae bacterium]
MMCASRREGAQADRSAFLAVIVVVCSIFLVVSPSDLRAADWPTYRADAARSGIAPAPVSPPLSPHWTYRPVHAPKPAWPTPAEERHRMAFDRACFVTMAGGSVFFGSSVTGEVIALDAATGQTRWTFATEGPVRFAPSVWQGRVYVGSDDGNVYCLSAGDGKLVWKHRPGPSDAKLIGNGRMISRWPIRTSVLVDGGVVYFAAGVFPYEGLYVCALKADDGAMVWRNDSLGDQAYELNFGGVTPQGYLVASEKNLYVPAGRAMPVALDRGTGRYLYVCDPPGKAGGSYALVADGRLIAGVDSSGTPSKSTYREGRHTRELDAFAWFPGLDVVVAPEITYILTTEGVHAIDRKAYAELSEAAKLQASQKTALNKLISSTRGQLAKAKSDRRKGLEKRLADAGKKLSEMDAEAERLKSKTEKWRYVGKDLRCLIVGGHAIYVGGDGVVTALDATSGAVLWNGAVDGVAEGLAVSDGRLCVSTDSGAIHCFGEIREAAPKVLARKLDRQPYAKDALTPVYESAAARILERVGTDKGWCLVLGCGEGRLAYELARRSQLDIVGIEADAARRAKAREHLGAAGMLGARVVVEDWRLADLPDYFANVIVCDALPASGQLADSANEIYRVLRPFGGAVCIGRTDAGSGSSDEAGLTKLADGLKRAGLSGAKLSKEGGLWVMGARGKLAGAGSWTQLYGGPHNTACSDDQLAVAPFGVLWFGEPGPQSMVERHARAASPVAGNGRLYIQGEEIVTGVDAYNGTILWTRKLPGAVRVRADVDGGNMAVGGDDLYVAAEGKCYRLGGETGEVARVYNLPDSPKGEPRRWGYVSRPGDALLGSAALPLSSEYAAIWKALVKDGRWRDLGEIPPRHAGVLEGLRAMYPVPDKLARAEMQRSGALWRHVADFPAWGSEKDPIGTTPRVMVSDAVFALDADTGKQRWVYRGGAIPQISITVGDGVVYFVDNEVTAEQRAAALAAKQDLIKRGVYEADPKTKASKAKEDVRLVVALDLATGKKPWAQPMELTGCGGDKLGTAYEDGLLVFFGHFSNHDGTLFKNSTLRWRRITAVDVKGRQVVWSKPLNYLRRPVVVGDQIIIEPRACDLRTGEIKMRPHPISGESVPWEFLRPGHSCGITSGAPNCIFYRSYCGAIYDLKRDTGLTLFGAIRPGCWLNLISANGLLMMPEASSGCTCSFPLRCSVVLKPSGKAEEDPWSVFITHGPTAPARHLAVNLGAPGDRRDASGTLWLASPRPQTRGAYGTRYQVEAKVLPGMGHFCQDHRGESIPGTDRPWLFTSGCLGLVRCALPLIDDVWSDGPGTYTVRLGFAAPAGDVAGARVFDVKLQGRVVAKDLDVAQAAGGAERAIVKEFKGVKVATALEVELVSKVAEPGASQAPFINCIEVVREDVARLAAKSGATGRLSDEKAKALLATADTARQQGKSEEALRGYHAVLDGADSAALKVAALDGVGAIGSGESLGRIARYCQDIDPILHDYQSIPLEVRRAGTAALIAVAGKVAGADKARAARMLDRALALAKELKDEKIQRQVLGDLARLRGEGGGGK